MKKFYLLSLLFCICTSAFGQSTIYIYATGTAGTFVTGSSTSTTRTDNGIISATFPAQTRGYAVFDLSSIPSGATITAAEIDFYVSGYFGGGPAPSGWATYGYVGDLATFGTAASLYPAMISGTLLTNASYGTAVGNRFLASNAASVNFIQTNYPSGTPVSICWTGGNSHSYTITGETGVASPAPTANNAPYLKITYNCAGVSGVTATGPAGAVCANTAFSLNATETGATSYSWSGPAGFSSTLLNPTVSGGATVTGTYTFSVSNAGGCTATTTVNVVINPAPSSVITVANSEAFCPGDSAVLTAPLVAGNTYQWYDSGAVIAGATNDYYHSFGNGNYTVKVTDGLGCTGTTAVGTPVVLLNAPPVIAPASPVLLCLGDNGTMTVNTNGVTTGINFQWQKNGVDIPGAISNSYNTTSSGVYHVTINVPANGCSVTSLSDTVVVNAYPTPAISAAGIKLQTSSTYALYQWFVNTVAVSGATSYSLTPPSNGSYRVRVTDANGCAAYSAAYPYYTVGVAQLNNPGVSIYPNPAGNIVHIESPVQVKAMITGMEGRILLQQADAKDIDISRLANGMYIITLFSETGERIAVQQLVKE